MEQNIYRRIHESEISTQSSRGDCVIGDWNIWSFKYLHLYLSHNVRRYKGPILTDLSKHFVHETPFNFVVIGAPLMVDVLQ